MTTTYFWLFVLVIFIIQYHSLLEYYRKENVWRNTWPGDKINVRYRGNWQTPKKIVGKDENKLRIQHFGVFSRDEFINHLKKNPHSNGYYLELK